MTWHHPVRPLRSPWRILLRVGMVFYLTALAVTIAATWADAPYARVFVNQTDGWSDYLEQVLTIAAFGFALVAPVALLVAVLLWIVALVWARTNPQLALTLQSLIWVLAASAGAIYIGADSGLAGVVIMLMCPVAVVGTIWGLRRWRQARSEVPA